MWGSRSGDYASSARSTTLAPFPWTSKADASTQTDGELPVTMPLALADADTLPASQPAVPELHDTSSQETLIVDTPGAAAPDMQGTDEGWGGDAVEVDHVVDSLPFSLQSYPSYPEDLHATTLRFGFGTAPP